MTTLSSLRTAHPAPTCGGAAILDLALCLILAVTVVGLLLLTL
ncbi:MULTISPECIES: hypothetical protein [Methylobacterium]|jgi:hypothetical protein|uniref:Uncharacterized protein n=3 Tax=Methylobacterium TaxID=407 RepID=A0AAE8HNQ4_9HYPH|nr:MULTISPECIES: hypothetical protein [Methylobacterium]AIQ91823.1 protein of unassigned function [Methylobacterium oryzae CBMB20]APT32324.1 hypothetical protein MCBMB27_03033 [Methylobacterium phyllosphaerae]MBA9065182.1 hypothetical protein [Methylobacterium fujisawaense]MDE4911886.1 hypothetical protein [Methylobacterium sp. 092160098-2]MDH3028857.1 hypothetical protein [Methylobacterium fujisawaense]